MLQRIPDSHDGASVQHTLDALGYSGCYDAVYVPMKNSSNANLRYAFVNFLRAEDGGVMGEAGHTYKHTCTHVLLMFMF